MHFYGLFAIVADGGGGVFGWVVIVVRVVRFVVLVILSYLYLCGSSLFVSIMLIFRFIILAVPLTLDCVNFDLQSVIFILVLVYTARFHIGYILSLVQVLFMSIYLGMWGISVCN